MKIKPGLEKEYEDYKALNSKGSDPAGVAYSMAVIHFTERWADLMEARIEAGSEMKDFAEVAAHAADTEGITGFQYGCAVRALAYFWQHGEALRLWHNIDTQIGKEGEEANKKGTVLNPAVTTIKT